MRSAVSSPASPVRVCSRLKVSSFLSVQVTSPRTVMLFVTLRAKLSGAVYCNRSCLFVCVGGGGLLFYTHCNVVFLRLWRISLSSFLEFISIVTSAKEVMFSLAFVC